MSKITAMVKWGNDVKELDDWQRQANQYTVTLRYQGRQLTTPFFTGPRWTSEPTAAEVLESLVSDATSVEYEGFEEWCYDTGLDTDSRRAERTYKACEALGRKLSRFLGGPILSVLQHAYKDDGSFRTDDDGNVIVP